MVIQESSRLETSAWFKRFKHLFSLTKRQKLVGGFNLPLGKMMEWVKVSWDDFPFPTVSGKSFKIPWFQSPPTSSPLHFPKVQALPRYHGCQRAEWPSDHGAQQEGNLLATKFLDRQSSRWAIGWFPFGSHGVSIATKWSTNGDWMGLIGG